MSDTSGEAVVVARVIGFGTLLHRASLGVTIGPEAAAEKVLRPVTVPGWRRLYNLRTVHLPPSGILTDEASGIEQASANIEPAAGCSFNGYVFDVTEAELAGLDAREVGYDRHEIAVLDFTTGEPMGTALAYVVPLDSSALDRNPATLLPRMRDIAYSRGGAYRESAAFGQAWDGTSFLADGETPVIARYQAINPGRDEHPPEKY